MQSPVVVPGKFLQSTASRIGVGERETAGSAARALVKGLGPAAADPSKLEIRHILVP